MSRWTLCDFQLSKISLFAGAGGSKPGSAANSHQNKPENEPTLRWNVKNLIKSMATLQPLIRRPAASPPQLHLLNEPSEITSPRCHVLLWSPAGATAKVILPSRQPAGATEAAVSAALHRCNKLWGQTDAELGSHCPPTLPHSAVINFTRSGPAHQVLWTIALTCAELIPFIAPARPSHVLVGSRQTCQTTHKIIVKGLASMPAHSPPSASSSLQTLMEPPASPARHISATTAALVWGLYNFVVLLPRNQEHQDIHVSQDLGDLAMSHTDRLSPDQLLRRNPSAWQECFGLSCSLLQQISIQIYSYAPLLPAAVQRCCHTISLASFPLFCSLLLLSVPLLLLWGLSSLWISIPPQCWGSPPAFFPLSFLHLCLPSCACLPATLLPLMFPILESSHAIRSCFWSHHTSARHTPLSVAHVLRCCRSCRLAGRSQLACVTAKLLSSWALWFIWVGWVTHFCSGTYIIHAVKWKSTCSWQTAPSSGWFPNFITLDHSQGVG